jgi:hypothetical protein
MKRLRLLKVVVQPTFVLVDDESIEEMQGQLVLASRPKTGRSTRR